jgi:hypothetical protein
MSPTLSHQRASAAAHDQPLGIESSFPDLIGLTETIFQTPAKIVIESDAELPAIRYAVVETTTGNDLKQLAARRGEWYRRARALLGADARKVRLSVDIRP